jgi:thioredoxin reductase (NADPH)
MSAPMNRPIIETEAVIIGAGPVGLFQVFELGLLEIKAHVIDLLPYPGGQCIELYPDKPIYDIPAVPVCTGKELTDNLLQQIEPFGPTFHYSQAVSTIAKQDDGRFLLETSSGVSSGVASDEFQGSRFLTKTIFIAAGMGAFQPRLLNLEGIDRLATADAAQQVFYKVSNRAGFANQDVVILGGGDSALDWALDFVKDGDNKAKSVTLVHRRDGFAAAPASVAKMRALCEAGQMKFSVGQVTAFETQDDRMTAITVTGIDGSTTQVPLDQLLIFFGLSPKLGPIAEWGLDIERRQLKVDTEKFSTSVPGIFAVGDINTYPGKKKLILSGFHECALAAFGAAAIIFPDKKVMLQYTTTSTKLHKVLGVETPVFER